MAAHIRTARSLVREIKGGNPLRASILLLLIIALFIVALVWAAFTELDAVTRADGRIVPSAEVQIVQPSEPGVISEIHVSEGDVVQPGSPLITLDDTQIEGELAQARSRVQSLELRVARLKSEVYGSEFDPGAQFSGANPALVASEAALFAARSTARADEIRVLERQGRQRRQQVREAESRVETARQGLALIEEEIALIRPLVESAIEPRTTLIGLLGRRSEASGRLLEAEAALAGATDAVAEIEDRIVSAKSLARAEALNEMARAEAELAEARVRLPALETRLTRAVLSAPARGVVNRLLMGTIGGLARAGDGLVEIVPIEDELLVEAYLPPADVAFVRPGQDVRISVTAYDASRYGAIDGTILRVGADAVTRPDRDERVFIVEIRTSGSLTDAEGVPVDIVPGMTATVDILSGKRTVLDYLTEPIVRVKETALRD